MKADQGEGCEGEAGTFANELPAPSQKYADLSSKPRAMHASTIKWRIFPTGGTHRLRLLEHSKNTGSTISKLQEIPKMDSIRSQQFAGDQHET